LIFPATMLPSNVIDATSLRGSTLSGGTIVMPPGRAAAVYTGLLDRANTLSHRRPSPIVDSLELGNSFARSGQLFFQLSDA